MIVFDDAAGMVGLSGLLWESRGAEMSGVLLYTSSRLVTVEQCSLG